MTKEYYKILGLAEFDSAENVKIAYKKLVRQYHPDIAGNSDANLTKFKEIREAYEVLSNPLKKEEYDRIKKFYSYAKKNSETSNNKKDYNNAESTFKGFNFNWEDLLSKKNNCNKKNDVKTPKRGDDIYTDVEITLLEAINGASKVINMLQTKVCPVCNGKKFANGSICNNCNGKGELSKYKKFTVKIPAGIKNKSKIRLSGEGLEGINGGKNGDLYITVHIKETKDVKFEGLNIIKTLPITPYEAVLGTNIKLTTVNGVVNVKIAPGTQNGQKIRLSGLGTVQNEKIGDMIIIVEIRIPKKISNKELELYKKLEEASLFDIRESLND